MSQPRWTKLVTYNFGLEVDLLCVSLDAQAIPHIVRGMNRGMDGPAYQGIVPGGLDVLVPEDALSRARLVLASHFEPG